MAENQQSSTSPRGFAAMDQAKQKEIASKGGRAAHLKGTAHEFTSEEARAAGRKGGQSVSQDRAHMSQIGRQGGQARGGARRRLETSGTSQLGETHDTDTGGHDLDTNETIQ